MIEKVFKEKQLKLTKQRKLVYNIISKNNDVTLKEIEERCNNKINITTIYRILDKFLEKDIINKKVDLNKEIYYEIKPIKHTHYIKCIKCHNKIEIDEQEIEKFENKVCKEFKIVSHDIEFTGICKNCNK